jgi:hypothetical protein
MAKGKRRTFGENFVQVPNSTAKAPEIKNNENPISLEALGLIVNLLSYAESWELHKTEIYKRFAFNKETSVKKAWNELIKAGYMVEYKYRVGKKWEYEYVYDFVPYTEEQRAIIWSEAVEEHGKVWGLDFQDLKMKSSNCGPQNQEISNTKLKKNELKKDKLNKDEIKPLINDDEKAPFEINIFAFKEFVKEFNHHLPNVFDNDMYNSIYQEMQIQKIDVITYKEAVRQAKYMKEKEAKGEIIGDYAKYFIGGIKRKRTSKASAIGAEKVRQAEQRARERKEQEERERAKTTRSVPFYNWLEE